MNSLTSTSANSTTDYQIDALLSGNKWEGQTITYSFFKSGSYYGSETGVSEVSEGIKQNVRLILEQYIEPLINVNFVEVTDTQSGYGQMRYMFSDGPSYAYAYYPYSFSDVGGDVHLDAADDQIFQGGIGSYGFQTLIHETLHALGLKHPGNYGNSTSPFLSYGEDNNTNTVMSYNTSGSSAATPMPYDIKALQYLYGAKSFNGGNTTYSFDSVYKYTDGSRTWGNATTPIKLAIWDSGGVDTLDFSHLADDASGYRFDLNQGGILTSQSAYNQSPYTPFPYADPETQYTSSYGTAIAYGVTIENAIGSSSNDTIFGNSAANVISGGDGNDLIYGGTGDDSLYGGAGNDSLYGDAGNDSLYGGVGNDSLYGGAGNDRIEGEAGNDMLNGGVGNDILIGGLGNDTYVVNSIGDVVTEAASEGTDTVKSTISYTLGADLENLTLTGSNAIDGTGNALNNTIKGNSAVNILNGGAGNDTLNGGANNDILVGDIGNDTLIGGAGYDRLTGGAGNDRFYFYNQTEGVDTITDFNVLEDTIYVSRLGFGGGLTSRREITADQFRLGAAAGDSSDRFIYNQNTGDLFFDADGTGASGQISIASLGAGLAMTNQDIVVFG